MTTGRQLITASVACSQKRELNDGIANFYDESSELWESMWGEHMHHGYYPEGNTQISNQQAQIDMIERTLSWAGVEAVSKASSSTPFLSSACALSAHVLGAGWAWPASMNCA